MQAEDLAESHTADTPCTAAWHIQNPSSNAQQDHPIANSSKYPTHLNLLAQEYDVYESQQVWLPHLRDVRSRMIDLLNDQEIKALGSAFTKINAGLRSPD